MNNHLFLKNTTINYLKTVKQSDKNVKTVEDFGKLKQVFKKIGSNITKGLEKIGSAVNWKSVGKHLYNITNTVIPIKVFVKISKGERLNTMDILDLVSLVPIPAAKFAKIGGKLIAKSLAKTIAKNVAKKFVKGFAKRLAKQAVKRLAKRTIKDLAKSLAKKAVKSLAKKAAKKAAKSLVKDLTKSETDKIKKLIHDKIHNKIIKDEAKYRINHIIKNLKNKDISEKDKQKIADAKNSIRTKVRNEFGDIHTQKYIKSEIDDIIKLNMNVLGLKLPDTKVLEKINKTVASSTVKHIENKQLIDFNKELGQRIKTHIKTDLHKHIQTNSNMIKKTIKEIRAREIQTKKARQFIEIISIILTIICAYIAIYIIMYET